MNKGWIVVINVTLVALIGFFGFRFLLRKEQDARQEAVRRCTQEVGAKGERAILDCAADAMAYYQVNSRLPGRFGANLPTKAPWRPPTQASAPTSVLKAEYVPEVQTIGLPPGQHFMYIIPAQEAVTVFGAAAQNIYVTSEASGFTEASPRLIRFLQPGHTPGSWEEVRRIQER